MDFIWIVRYFYLTFLLSWLWQSDGRCSYKVTIEVCVVGNYFVTCVLCVHLRSFLLTSQPVKGCFDILLDAKSFPHVSVDMKTKTARGTRWYCVIHWKMNESGSSFSTFILSICVFKMYLSVSHRQKSFGYLNILAIPSV